MVEKLSSRSFTAVVFLIVSLGKSGVYADTPAAPPGSHAVKINVGGRVTSIWVQDQPGITSTLVSSEPGYHPEQFDPRKTSSFANKQFSTAGFDDRRSAALPTKSGLPTSSSPFAPTKAEIGDSTFSTFTVDLDSKTVDFGKSYATRADAEANELYLGASRSSDLAKKEVAFKQELPLNAFPLGSKSYQGREIEPQQGELNALNKALAGRMRDVPNRPLTIDEVKALINHEVKPNLDAPARDHSKALNDPTYQENPSPAPPARPPLIATPGTAREVNTDLSPGPGEVSAGVTEESQTPDPLPAK